MAMKSMMIDFQIPRTNPSIQVILTIQYINRDGNIVTYTIGGQKAVNEMQRKLM